MRSALILAGALALGAAALGACASTGEQTTSSNLYASELDQLQRDCAARGGNLIPGPRLTGRPQTDYACDIRGPDSGPQR